MKIVGLFLFIFCACFNFSAQEENESEPYDQNAKKDKIYKNKSFFGVCFKPTFPTRVLRAGPVNVENDSVTMSIIPKYGFSLGMNVRIGLSKQLSIESGLVMVQRNYELNYEFKKLVKAKNEIGILNFELPINLLVYIQLTKKVYSSVSGGTAISFFPTELTTDVIIENYKFTQEARRQKRTSMDLNANFGFEYRSDKKGTIYAGISTKIPFKPIFTTATILEQTNNNKSIIYKGNVFGSFISLDFKYFFHNKKKKGVQFQGGPILQ